MMVWGSSVRFLVASFLGLESIRADVARVAKGIILGWQAALMRKGNQSPDRQPTYRPAVLPQRCFSDT